LIAVYVPSPYLTFIPSERNFTAHNGNLLESIARIQEYFCAGIEPVVEIGRQERAYREENGK
jgi:hypothetical protein